MSSCALNQKIYQQIEDWRQRPLRDHYVYVYLDGLWLKRFWGGEVENVSILVAIGVNEMGFCEVCKRTRVVGSFPGDYIIFLNTIEEEKYHSAWRRKSKKAHASNRTSLFYRSKSKGKNCMPTHLYPFR